MACPRPRAAQSGYQQSVDCYRNGAALGQELELDGELRGSQVAAGLLPCLAIPFFVPCELHGKTENLQGHGESCSWNWAMNSSKYQFQTWKYPLINLRDGPEASCILEPADVPCLITVIS